MVSTYQKWCNEEQLVNLHPRLIDACGEQRQDGLVQSHRRAAVNQIAENLMLGMIERCQNTKCLTVCCTWGCIAANRSGAHDVHHGKFNNGHMNIKTGLWSNEIRLPGLIKHFLLDQVDGRVHVRYLPGEVMAVGCTKGRRPTGRVSVMIWTILCCETLGPGIHVDVTLTHSIYLKIVLNNSIS